MVTKTVDIHDAQQHLVELLALALSGTEVVLTEGDIPRVRLVPVNAAERRPRTPDLFRGQIHMADDFDAELPEDFWEGKG